MPLLHFAPKSDLWVEQERKNGYRDESKRCLTSLWGVSADEDCEIRAS